MFLTDPSTLLEGEQNVLTQKFLKTLSSKTEGKDKERVEQWSDFISALRNATGAESINSFLAEGIFHASATGSQFIQSAQEKLRTPSLSEDTFTRTGGEDIEDLFDTLKAKEARKSLNINMLPTKFPHLFARTR